MRRLFIALISALALTGVSLGQIGVTPGPPPGMGRKMDPITSLKNALDLTDAQVSAIQALIQAQRQSAESIMADMKQKRLTLESLLNATSPNPTDVGNAAIAVHNAEKQLQALHQSLLADIRKQLTIDQQNTLDALIKAGAMLPGLGGFGPMPRGMRGPHPGGF